MQLDTHHAGECGASGDLTYCVLRERVDATEADQAPSALGDFTRNIVILGYHARALILEAHVGHAEQVSRGKNRSTSHIGRVKRREDLRGALGRERAWWNGFVHLFRCQLDCLCHRLAAHMHMMVRRRRRLLNNDRRSWQGRQYDYGHWFVYRHGIL